MPGEPGVRDGTFANNSRRPSTRRVSSSAVAQGWEAAEEETQNAECRMQNVRIVRCDIADLIVRKNGSNVRFGPIDPRSTNWLVLYSVLCILPFLLNLLPVNLADADADIFALFQAINLAVPDPENSVGNIQHFHVMCGGNDRNAFRFF